MADVLIVKGSYSTLPSGELKSTLGDVVRATVLLDCIDGDWLWLTDGRSLPILERFVDRSRLVTDAGEAARQARPNGLTVFNADTGPVALEAACRIGGSWHGYVRDDAGARWVPENPRIAAITPYSGGLPAGLSWQQAMVEGMGFAWSRQDYALPLQTPAAAFDVGLNWEVAAAWESKRWPRSHWTVLEALLTRSCSVSWQAGMDDMATYLDWLAVSRLVVTCDSLGLHLASAMRKKVVALLGPTSVSEYPYGRVAFIVPPSRSCMPCEAPVCRELPHCMPAISPEMVSGQVLRTFDTMCRP